MKSPRASRLLRAGAFLGVVVVLVALGAVFFSTKASPTCGAASIDRLARRTGATPNATGSFSTDDGRVLNYDFYRPGSRLNNGAGDPPLVIYVHGGGWSSLTRDLAPTSPPLALCRRGYAIASVDYRRTDDGVSWPTPAADVAAAVRAIAFAATAPDGTDGSARGLAIDLERIALWGDSAGGHLASFVALGANDAEVPDGFPGGAIDLGPATVRGVIGGAAITDFTDETFATWAEDIPGVNRCPVQPEEPGELDEPGEPADTEGSAEGQGCDGLPSFWPCVAAGQVPGTTDCTSVIEASVLRLFGCQEHLVESCGQIADHPFAVGASPVTYVDSCDPPHMLLSDPTPPEMIDGNLVGDFLVPPSQQTRLIEALNAVGVDTGHSRDTPGTGHLAITNDAATIADLGHFLSEVFGAPGPAVGC